MEISLGAAAFWIALAAVLIAGKWFGAKREALRQETLLRLIEKTGQLDEQQVKALFPPPPPLPPHWFAPPVRHDGRRALKVFGTITLAVAAGIALFGSIMLGMGAPAGSGEAAFAFAGAAFVACIGVGLIVAARFVRPPVPRERGDRETA